MTDERLKEMRDHCRSQLPYVPGSVMYMFNELADEVERLRTERADMVAELQAKCDSCKWDLTHNLKQKDHVINAICGVCKTRKILNREGA